ncbi:MAG: hypothetical protein K0R92_29 [Lachnospiraceae bacterium]|jgi:hypothetical protein|nr:hypothetical protein [Lachnospiraceae bacterium]
MPIKPIDIVTMAPKSQEVSQYKHQESQRTLNEQAQLNNQFNSQIKHNNQQTVKTLKGDNQEYRYDAKEKGNNPHHQKKNKKDKEKNSNSETTPKDKINPGSFDIKI